MNVILDVVSPMLVLEQLALQVLPAVLWVLLVVLLLSLSVAGIRFVIKRLQADDKQTSQSEATDFSEDDSRNN